MNPTLLLGMNQKQLTFRSLVTLLSFFSLYLKVKFGFKSIIGWRFSLRILDKSGNVESTSLIFRHLLCWIYGKFTDGCAFCRGRDWCWIWIGGAFNVCNGYCWTNIPYSVRLGWWSSKSQSNILTWIHIYHAWSYFPGIPNVFELYVYHDICFTLWNFPGKNKLMSRIFKTIFRVVLEAYHLLY